MNPNEHWINMAMTGVTPELAMRTANESLKFYISQMELECENKMNRFGNQCREQCQGMKSKCIEKMEQVREAYEKLGKRCGLLEQEVANLTKDKQELQEKFSETSRKKRKLNELYDQLSREFESVKHTATQRVNREDHHFLVVENREPTRKDRLSFYSPAPRGSRDQIWPARQNSANSGPLNISDSFPSGPVERSQRSSFLPQPCHEAGPVFGSGEQSTPRSSSDWGPPNISDSFPSGPVERSHPSSSLPQPCHE
ncbi:hypothetical protein N665_0917s0006 [Sinapis alba]|nr:hypothetical protein N665_0917s0006 [Sinapis alba]